MTSSMDFNDFPAPFGHVLLLIGENENETSEKKMEKVHDSTLVEGQASAEFPPNQQQPRRRRTDVNAKVNILEKRHHLSPIGPSRSSTSRSDIG